MNIIITILIIIVIILIIITITTIIIVIILLLLIIFFYAEACGRSGRATLSLKGRFARREDDGVGEEHGAKELGI